MQSSEEGRAVGEAGSVRTEERACAWDSARAGEGQLDSTTSRVSLQLMRVRGSSPAAEVPHPSLLIHAIMFPPGWIVPFDAQPVAFGKRDESAVEECAEMGGGGCSGCCWRSERYPGV